MTDTDVGQAFIPAATWRHHNPVRTTFGRQCRQQLADELQSPSPLAGEGLGRGGTPRTLIVTTRRGRAQLENDPILSSLTTDRSIAWLDNTRPNPDLNDLQATIDDLAGQTWDRILAFGGGSVLDSAKVIAVALAPEIAGQRLADLLADPTRHAHATPVPLHAVPTTAGTGSEVTPFATVWDFRNKHKHSLSGPAAFPRAAWVDPELTDDLPVAITRDTGLDAINQAAESIWNRNATPVTEALATRALQLGLEALPPLLAGAGGQGERDRLAEASLLAGLAISQTRTALCHAISYALTAYHDVPHGLACAFTMPAVLRFNLAVDDGRLARLATRLGGPDAGADSGPGHLLARFDRLHDQCATASTVRALVQNEAALQAHVAEMPGTNRSANNLRTPTPNDVTRILTESWHEERRP